MSDDIERLRLDVENLDGLTKEAKEKHQDAWDRSSKFKVVIDSLNSFREKQQWLRKRTESLAGELKILPESDASLQNELDRFDERMRLREDEKQKQTNKYDQLRRVMESTRERLQGKHAEAGRCEEKQASHDQNVESRKDIIKETAVRHNIRGYDAGLDDKQINEYMRKISKLYRDQTDKVKQAHQETEKETQKVQAVLSELGERKSGLQEQKSSTKQQSSANDRGMESFQSELDSIDIDEGAEALSKSKVQDIEDNLKQAKEKFKMSSWDAKIDDAKLQLRKAEDQIEQTKLELARSTKQSNDLIRLGLLKNNLSDRKRSLETLKGAHNDRLRKIIGDGWSLASLERDFQTELDRRSTALKVARDRQNTFSRDLNQVEAEIDSYKGQLQKAEKELQECAQIITKATQGSPDTYQANLDGIQRDRDILKADVDDFAITRKLCTRSIKVAEGKGICDHCKRKFHDEPERSDFLKRMQKKLEENTQKDMEKELKGLEDDLVNWRSIGPKHSSWLQLSGTNIPRLRSEIRRLDESKAVLVKQSEDRDREVADRVESSRDAESLSKPVANIVRFQSEISELTEQVKDLSAEQNDAGIGRPIDEVQEQIDKLMAEARAKNNLILNLTDDKQQALSDIGAKEVALSRAREDLGTATHKLEKKSRLFKQIEELRKFNRENRDTIRRLDDEIQQLSPQVSEQNAKLDDIKNRGNRKEQELNQEATQLSDSLQKLSTVDQHIQAFKDSGGPLRLSRCQREIQHLVQEIEKTDAEQKQLIKEINALGEELRNHQDTRRTIVDNLTYRQSKRELEDIEKEISRLSAEEAESDMERLKQKQRYWENQYHKHSTEKSGKLATMKEKDDRLQKLLQDWQTDYANAAHEYKEAHIKVEVRSAKIECWHQRLITDHRQPKRLWRTSVDMAKLWSSELAAGE